MMVVTGRPREFDRDAALDAAMRLFWRNGYQSTSMTELCEAMHIRSPSLYAAYGSKEALYLETMDRYAKIVGASFWDRVETAATARDGIEAMLLAATEALPGSPDAPPGCMAMLAAMSDAWPQTIDDTARAIRADCLAKLRNRLADAVAKQELPAGIDVEGTARFYFGIFQAMAAQAKDGARAADLTKIVERAMAAWPAKPEDLRG